MANFDAIFDENFDEDEHHSRVSDEYVPMSPDPIVIRGIGHMTVYVVLSFFTFGSRTCYMLPLFAVTNSNSSYRTVEIMALFFI